MDHQKFFPAKRGTWRKPWTFLKNRVHPADSVFKRLAAALKNANHHPCGASLTYDILSRRTIPSAQRGHCVPPGETTVMAQSIRPMPPALPERIEDWHRNLKIERTLNDLVEDVHRILVEDDQYRAYLRAVYDEQAVEGSLSHDNAFAAAMIRERAKLMGSEVANEKTGSIAKALNVVLRRYNATRKQRRNMVGGEAVPSDQNDC